MISNAALWKIIGADALGTITRTNLAATRFRAFALSLLPLHIVKTCAQDLHGTGTVLVLRFFGLHHHDARWNMGNTHSRVSRVDVLTTGTGGAHRIDADILVADFNVDIFGFRQHRNGCSGCMNAPARFGFRHALHAMHT
ncbi:hypothetical protein D9M69_570630 [compost metagenome]